jgi:hypothetical protein
MEEKMGIFDKIFGLRKSASTTPVCAACGKPVRENPRRIGGVIMFEGTECSSCGNAYCLYCHNFGVDGPKCPGCGEYKLGMLLRPE